MLHVDPQALALHLVPRVDLVEGPNPAGRHTRPGQLSQKRLAVSGSESRLEHFDQLASVAAKAASSTSTSSRRLRTRSSLVAKRASVASRSNAKHSRRHSWVRNGREPGALQDDWCESCDDNHCERCGAQLGDLYDSLCDSCSDEEPVEDED